jgi:hypothetical protein
MDGSQARKLSRWNQSSLFASTGWALLVASLIWNARQYSLLAQRHQQDLAEEQQRALMAKVEVYQAQARLAKKAQQDAANARIQQLYREIDSLGWISEQVLTGPGRSGRSRERSDSMRDTTP